jgi:DNA-binding MarR family transcriptional regulator
MSQKVEPAEFFADPVNSLGYLTRIVSRSFSRALEKRTLPHGVSSGQWRFLRALWLEEGLSQRELSRRVGTQEPTTVTALKGLERNGLVRRVPSVDDRRRVHVYLTPEAKKLRRKLAPYVVEVNALATRHLTPKQVQLLRQLLMHVGQNLADEDTNGNGR